MWIERDFCDLDVSKWDFKLNSEPKFEFKKTKKIKNHFIKTNDKKN